MRLTAYLHDSLDDLMIFIPKFLFTLVKVRGEKPLTFTSVYSANVIKIMKPITQVFSTAEEIEKSALLRRATYSSGSALKF